MRTVKSKLNTAFITAIIASAYLNFQKSYFKHTPLADSEEIKSMWEYELLAYDGDEDYYYFMEGSCCAVGELTRLYKFNNNFTGDAQLVSFLKAMITKRRYSMLVWYGPNSVKEHKHTADILKQVGFQPFAYCSRSNHNKGQIEALYFVIK